MKKYFPFAMALASTVGLIGCMNVNPSNLSKTLDSSLNADTTKSGLTNLSIRFKPEANYNTQAGGTYKTEIRLMYTEAIVRNDGYDYHFGIKGYTSPTAGVGTVAYQLNEGTPSLFAQSVNLSAGLPICAYYPAIPGADDPLFNLVTGATGSATLANVASDSFQTGSYFLSSGIYKDPTQALSPTAVPLDLLSLATGSGVVATFSDRLDSNMLRARPAVDSVDNVLKTIFKQTQVISYTTAAKTATASVLIDPKSVGTTGVTAPYIQAISGNLTAADGTTTITKGAVYFKMTLPALVKEVKFPALPLGRLVIDVRKYSGDNVVSSYSYGQFMLAPAGNALAVGDISGSITTENNPAVTF